MFIKVGVPPKVGHKISLAIPPVMDLIKQVLQLLRAELKELVDEARATIEPVEPYDKK